MKRQSQFYLKIITTVSKIPCTLLQVKASLAINNKQMVTALRVRLAPILHQVYFEDLKADIEAISFVSPGQSVFKFLVCMWLFIKKKKQ